MAPPKSLHWLASLKSTQLKALAAAIGTNSSGTKSALIAALQTHLPLGFFPQDPSSAADPSKKQHDIISIDMGIRNLAYCRITLPPRWPSSPTHSTNPAVPTISEWARIAVSSKAPTALSAAKVKSKNKGDGTSAVTDEEAPAIDSSATKEAFDPSTFSQHAYNLTTHLLNQHVTPPTQILIERQRFRSMGGSAVQEWTLRVNMFEAMLYAVLKTLHEQGKWTGSVHAVAPSKIGRFWLGEGEAGVNGEDVMVEKEGMGEAKGKGKGKETRGKMGTSKSAKTKTAKIRILEGWLKEVVDGRAAEEDRGRFKLEGNARQLGEAFLRKRRGLKDVKVRQKRIGGTEVEETEIGKLDDLADCVLQGMAWVKWEENRRRISECGEDALKELL